MDEIEFLMRAARNKRFVRCISATDIAALLAAITAVVGVGVSLAIGHRNSGVVGLVFLFAVLSAVVLAALVWAKTCNEFEAKTFDASKIIPFDARYFYEMRQERSVAAAACLEFLDKGAWGDVNEKENVELILDLLVDLAFYLKAGEFSDEVVHHHFFHWIRGWHAALHHYIPHFSEINGGDSPYGEIAHLYLRTRAIEMQEPRPKIQLEHESEIRKFLLEEFEEGEFKKESSKPRKRRR